MKLQSTLPQRVFFIHLAVMLDVVVLIFVLTMVTVRMRSDYGVSIKVPSSRLMMNVSDQRYVLSVTAGEFPVFFLNNKRVDGGVSQLKPELDRIAAHHGAEGVNRVTVVLYCDKAVNQGVLQSLIDLVVERGMNCAIAAQPYE